jgi:hypothetical protein
MRLLFAFLAVPVIAVAQASFPTEWPSGAEPLSPETLRQRLVGKTFVAKSLTSPDVRTEYRETYAYINIGNTNDSGRWRTEGSTVCNEWRNLRPACSEYRLLGETLYVKRANNGEIMMLVPQ